MREILVTLLSFADFWFLPLIFFFLGCLMVEQLVQRSDAPEEAVEFMARLRRFAWQQNLLLNVVWVLSFLLLQSMTTKDPFSDSGMIWK